MPNKPLPKEIEDTISFHMTCIRKLFDDAHITVYIHPKGSTDADTLMTSEDDYKVMYSRMRKFIIQSTRKGKKDGNA